MRTVRVNGVKLEVSKSEADFVSRAQTMPSDTRRKLVLDWLARAPTLEAGERRTKVARAFDVKVSEAIPRPEDA